MIDFVIQPADWACVPMANATIGKLVEIGQWANGDGFAAYEHVLGYAGHFDTTPDVGRLVPMVGSGPGHYVIEASPGGARLRRLAGRPQDIAGAVWSSGHYQLSAQQRENLLWTACEFLGTPYSGLDYFALAAHRLRLHPLDYALKARVASSRHLICSQLWDRVYNLNGVHLFTDGRWDGYVPPLDMAKLLLAR